MTTDDRINQLNDQELFNRLLTVPLGRYTINGGHETICVVVDGLDECTFAENNNAAKLLGQFADHFPKWLRVLVLSRKESSVTGWLNPDMQIDMIAGEEQNLADIRTYFAERLAPVLVSREDKEHLLDELTSHTEGVFLYAYVVSGMILDGKLDIADTDAYPEGLSNAFKAWFSRYFPNVLEYKRLYRLYLGMIAASPEPIPVEELEAVKARYDEAKDCYTLEDASDSGRRSKGIADRLKRINSLLQYRTNLFGKRTVAFTHTCNRTTSLIE